MSDDAQRFSDLLRLVAARGLQRGFQSSYEEGVCYRSGLETPGFSGALRGSGFCTLAGNPSCDF